MKMTNLFLTDEVLSGFARELEAKHRSVCTRGKYLHDARAFARFLAGRPVSPELTLEYRDALLGAGYSPSSVNTMLASLNALFRFVGREDCRAERTRVQREAFRPEERELTRDEYLSLLGAASSRERLILEAICSTGIRISELRYFTVEGVKRGALSVTCKGKTRSILITHKLKALLVEYAELNGITSGAIFLDRHGNPVGRGTVWAMMKRLARKSGVPEAKVFPHNLRKLFARMFYERSHDIAKLADVLGHSSVNTTRIYIMTTGAEHRAMLEQLDLIPDTEYRPSGRRRTA